MDIIVFGALLAFAISVIGLDYYRNVVYMGIMGGIVLVLIGIFVSVDNTFTILACTGSCIVNSTVVSAQTCTTQSLSSGSSMVFIAIGAMLMLVGAGVVGDVVLRSLKRREEDQFSAV